MSTLMAEGVGKRIVDALKMQNELEIVDKTQDFRTDDFQSEEVLNETPVEEVDIVENVSPNIDNTPIQQQPSFQSSQFQSANLSQPLINSAMLNAGKNMQAFNFQSQADFSNLEVPQNVNILRQLISQLPSGVSRQAGALVIKQTMEALGISMKSVLQEAQQLQESINLSSRECQNSILECKKQINNLELQVQQYQKQASSLNDIISLFVQIN